MRFVMMGLVLVAAGGAWAGNPSAVGDLAVPGATDEDPPICGWSYVLGCSGQGGDHWFEVDSNGEQVGGFTHTECFTCEEEDLEEGEEGCHPWGCEASEDALDQLAYRDAIEAADHADVEGLVLAAGIIPEYVFLNPARQSFQILSCNKQSVIANIPMAEEAFNQVRGLLPK